jgi:hypothetical protein
VKLKTNAAGGGEILATSMLSGCSENELPDPANSIIAPTATLALPIAPM